MEKGNLILLAHGDMGQEMIIERLKAQYKEQGVELVIVDAAKARELAPMVMHFKETEPVIELAQIRAERPIKSWKQHQSGRGKRKYYHK